MINFPFCGSGEAAGGLGRHLQPTEATAWRLWDDGQQPGRLLCAQVTQDSLDNYPIIVTIIILVTNLFLFCQHGPSGGGAGSSARLGGHR